MKVAGVVCEFDPFHNGHKYLLDKTRQSGITHIACAMSGDLTQRGGVAIADKQQRAMTAVANGADIVLELPPPFCCSCSEVFARSAVKLLAGVGAQVIAFGSEITDISLLKECADISIALSDNAQIKELTKQGLSYPRAMCEYIKENYGEEYSSVFSQPNATLGIEYIKAAREYGITDICPIKRIGAAHDSDKPTGKYVSASYIRGLILENKDHKSFVPDKSIVSHPADIRNMQGQILFTICQGDKDKLSAVPDINEQLLQSILHLPRYMPGSLDELFELLKSKNVTLARLRRIVLFLSAGLENTDVSELTAARVLALNKRGAQLLHNTRGSDIIFDTSLSRIGEAVPKIVQNIIKGSYFRYLCTDRKEPCINEYTRKIIIQ